MDVSKLKILYLTKQAPKREYTISKEILSDNENSFADSCVFSYRNYLDVYELNKKEKVFRNIYDFTEFCKTSIGESVNIDDELYKFELNYNLPVNKILYADRLVINYSENHRKQIIYMLVKFSLMLLEKTQYDVIIGELSSSSDLIFYYLSKHFKIKYLFFWHGRISNKMEFSDVLGRRHGLKELYINYKKNGFSQEEREYLNKYLEKFKKQAAPDYMKFSKQTKFKNLFRKLYMQSFVIRLKKYMKSYHIDLKYSADQSPKISEKINKKLKKAVFPIKSLLLKRYYDNVNLNKRYYLTPLHYQPESSTMTFAPYYLNQLAFIENLAKSIPGGTYIYVKEHPAMFANRKLSFYKELKKVPNIKLVHPEFSMNALIEKSMGVVTLTNTTGYEAIVKDKPVFVFGNVFYNEYDYSFKCNNFEEFRDNIITALRDWDRCEGERINNRNCFILACIRSLRKGNLNSHLLDKNFFKDENIKNIVNSIKDEIIGGQ